MRKKQWKHKICAFALCLSMVAAPWASVETVQAASADGIYAAAYQGATTVEDTTLPATATVNGTQQAITWSWRSSKVSTPYSTVTINGKAADGTTVEAQVEVIPAAQNELVYFIDAGRDASAGRESKAFDSVYELTGDTLLNSVADQTYNATDKWGRNSSSFTMKSEGTLDLTQKFLTGWYSSSKTSPLVYQYWLEAGTYTVSAGFYEWWNNRSMNLELSGSGMDTVTSDAVAVSGVGSSGVATVVIHVETACDVTMEVQNATGGEAPVISWFAVAEGEVEVPEAPVEAEVIIDGADVETAANNVNGLTYKGFGLLSGNSTSNLLMDYKAESPEAYEELLQVLFGGEHPLINHVKMEMGNDGNNSTGADSCTMRSETEEADASRSPGFQLAADAKAINPDVKVSFLRWQMPEWVQTKWDNDRTGTGYEAVYTWYRETIFDCYEKYGYIVDYVDPDKNETSDPDEDFIKWFKNRVSTETDFPGYMDAEAQEAYNNIKIIASDENTSLNIVPSMRADADLYNAVDAVGFHYRAGDETSTADYRTMAAVDDKEVWYSEGCATFSYTEYQENKNTEYGGGTIGGYQSPLALADNFIKSFVYSHKTHYIFQPAVGSFYEGAQYDHKEIISAREPWAGYVHYDPVIYMLQHFSKFSVVGWENADNTAGIWRAIPEASANNSSGSDHLRNESGNPSYVTLAAPDKSDVSVVAVNNSAKSVEYIISLNDMNITAGAPMEVWETKTDSYMQYTGEADYADGVYYVTVEPYSMVTITTLDCDGDASYAERLPEETEKTVLDTDEAGQNLDTTDDILYADDYEYAGYDADYLASRGNEPRYTVDNTGAFEVQDGKLVQVLNASVGQWNSGEPNCVIGDFRWMNYKASVDVTVSDSSYAGINIRQQTGMTFEGSGYALSIKKDGSWTLKKRSSTLASGSVTADTEGTYNLALQAKNDTITAWIDGVQVAEYVDSAPEYLGRVRLGCGWAETKFDNLKVEKLEGCEPYAEVLIDNAADDISYTGTWTTIAGGSGSNYDWYRSRSTTSTAGSAFSFDMTGSGFLLIGQNDGSAVLNVTIDGITYSGVTTMPSSQHYSTYIQKNIGSGAHEVTVEVVSGTFVLDAVMTTSYTDDAYDQEYAESMIERIESFVVYDYSQIEDVTALKNTYENMTDAQKAIVNAEKDYAAVIAELEAAVAALEGTTTYIQDQSQNAFQIPFASTADFRKSGDEVVMTGVLPVPFNDVLTSVFSGDTTSFTVEVEVTPTGDPEYNMFAGKGDNAFALRTRPGHLDFHIYAGGSWRAIEYVMPTDMANNWLNNKHQVAGMYDADTDSISLYCDGQMVVSQQATTTTSGVASSSYNLTLGACPQETDRTSQAEFAAMRVYNKALTAAELATQNTDAPQYAADDTAVELWVDFDTIVKAEEPKVLPFTDVAEGNWFYDAVYNCYFDGLMTGMTDTTFAPYDQLSRAQLAIILYRMEGSPTVTYSPVFSDVEEGAWFSDAVLWAQANGIVTGYGDGSTFGPHDKITREQIMVMMYRYANYKDHDVNVTAELDAFTDASIVSPYAETAVKWAVGTGVVTGKAGGTQIDPSGNTLRGECAMIIDRFMEYYK